MKKEKVIIEWGERKKLFKEVFQRSYKNVSYDFKFLFIIF